MVKLAKTYVALMDASVLMTRAMWEVTTLRREIIKNELIEPYKSLVDNEKNPAWPSWLAGDDIHAAIKKAKENAMTRSQPRLAGRVTTGKDLILWIEEVLGRASCW